MLLNQICATIDNIENKISIIRIAHFVKETIVKFKTPTRTEITTYISYKARVILVFPYWPGGLDTDEDVVISNE